MIEKISLKEKIGYALGDGAANIAWRGVATFLFIFYVDVFGLDPAAVGMLMLVARFGDGISDVLMGVLGDRTVSKYGKFRPWILWTAVPLAMILALLFTTPDLSSNGKVIYAYVTYILFTLIYTANNIPYGALMAVMTGDNKQRTTLGSFRMAGAFTGGMLVQGVLLYLVLFFGNVNPEITISPIKDTSNYEVVVSTIEDVQSVRIKTDNGIGKFVWKDKPNAEPTSDVRFPMKANDLYTFIVSDMESLTSEDIQVINQKAGYSNSIYVLSVFLALFMVVTFLTTKERVKPPVEQKSNLWVDLKDLIRNKPWLVLLTIGLLFNVYNSIKQGIVVIYFVHYVHNELLAASYMTALTFASIGGAMATAPLGKKFGKKSLFICALLLSAIVNASMVFMSANDIGGIFTLGIISEFASAIFPTLFFVMLGDAADYSEWKNGRRSTGLVYSAGSFATKFGGGIAAAIIGFVLASFGYDGQNSVAIQGAIPGVVMLMSWVPAIVAVVAAGVLFLYPLDQDKMDAITYELDSRRSNTVMDSDTSGDYEMTEDKSIAESA